MGIYNILIQYTYGMYGHLSHLHILLVQSLYESATVMHVVWYYIHITEGISIYNSPQMYM